MSSALRLIIVWCGLQVCKDLTLPQTHTHTHTHTHIQKRPHRLCPPGSSVHEDSPGKNTKVGCHVFLQGNLPNPGIKPGSPTLKANSLQSEPRGKPKNTEGSSLSLLQGIFPTQELNWSLLHYRQILYQLSYQGSPKLINSRNGK